MLPIVLFLLLELGGSLASCPIPESIFPACTCREMGDSFMACTGIMSPEELIRPILAVSTYHSKTFAIEVRNSTLLYVPHNLFKGTHFERIRFVNSQVMSLSDTDEAFIGLEDTLTELRATDAHYIARWDWHQLRNLHKLTLIDVNWISMGSLPEPLPELKHLEALGITNAEISYIVDHAFSNLKSLRILNLKNNDIREVKRNMLPDPANELEIIDFSYNELTSLPGDFFKNMAALKNFYLSSNSLVVISEKPFDWPVAHLDAFMLVDNPLRCDCRLQWIAGRRLPYEFVAKCTEPASLAGREFHTLTNSDLTC